ncbi:MAG: hypothetical protein QOG32_1080, partial [Chloroflexota bacterium]|nr:hypothetical protein [Chloroflexota bacterium]
MAPGVVNVVLAVVVGLMVRDRAVMPR